MVRKLLLLILVMSVYVSARCQPKDFYSKVDLIVWVVNDVKSVADGWRNVGFASITDQGIANLSNLTYKGAVAKTQIHIYTAYLGGAKILWIQPLSGKSAFSEFLRKNGNGVFALMHDVPYQTELISEVNRLNKLGVNVLQMGQVMVDNKPLIMTFMNTANKGKYALGLLTGPTQVFNDYELDNLLGMEFNQFAFAIKPANTQSVSAYWEKLGFPAMQVTHGETWGKQYYGQAADFDMELGWHRFGEIVYEWCIPLKPPTVYEDHIKKYGEGFQHLGFKVHDMDEAIRHFVDRGFQVSMSGGWGEQGKAGSGRFAYINTEKIGGETIELLWNYKK
jgi:hypothetical protein